MRRRHNLGRLQWTLAGWTPYVWRQQRAIESGVSQNAEVTAIPAGVPGSVQGALRAAGIIPDWNVGLQARQAEWVENRHWIYTARLPDDWLEPGSTVRMRALGLDYSGWVLLNGREIGSFTGSLVPHTFDLTGAVRERDNTLQIVLDCPPRWLGQIGYTSRMTEWKPRFNYFWDWTSRLVQLGIWDDLTLEISDGEAISTLETEPRFDVASGTGLLTLRGAVEGDATVRLDLSLKADDARVHQEQVSVDAFAAGITWTELPVRDWWPNGSGEQPLYTLRCRAYDASGYLVDEVSRRIGFTSIQWEACEGAPREADPWLCVVNGKPVFLQGVNWTPILPNFADVSDDDYRRLLTTYRDLGCNVLRIWGGAFLEKEIFYDLCDELGLLVWQEFPLSSSGLDNRPPDGAAAVEEMAAIAESYVVRRRHHVCLLLWCGGNELQDGPPIDTSHPMIARMRDVVARLDPGRRFLPTSASGPRFGADPAEFGRGLHWDVHGPWNARGPLDGEWKGYWEGDDALFRSEVGVPGASPVRIIRRYRGDLPEVPGTNANPLWRRTGWWIEWPEFVAERGREPHDLEEYVAWSQERQRAALAIAASTCKERFPRCGGFIIWMGHDSFPCTANTAIVDFDGNLKPAALAVGEIFRRA